MTKPNARPKVIDLFAGVGGLSLGFEQAGFDVAAAAEIDPIHCAAHEFNFPNSSCLPSSVTDLSGDDILRKAGLKTTDVAVVCGGAPCQGFSLIGQRQLDDPRNQLVKDFVRIVGELEAPYFVFENVKGLTLGRHRQFLNELIDEFDSLGYETVSPWRVLNAKSFGVPQNRERLILMGFRKGLRPPSYPTEGLWGLSPPTCFDALSDLPDAEDYGSLLYSDTTEAELSMNCSRYASRLRCVDRSDWFYGYRREWDSRVLTSSLRTEHTEISRRRFQATEPGKVEPISRFFKLPPHGVSNTLRAGSDSARGAFTSPRPIHYEHPRCVTVREMARLHGFPDWFRFHTTKWHGARQIGNAVPPPLAKAVADEIRRVLPGSPKVPSLVLELGDEELLSFDMSQASRYFGVSVPIAKRDRKSGVRKRKQAEIEAEITGGF